MTRPRPATHPVASTNAKPTRSAPPYLVPVLTFRQEAILRLLAFAWVVATVAFFAWWLAPERGAWGPLRIVATSCLAWLFLLGAYFLFFAGRMTRPNPALTLPKLRVAMVVTMAPSEPWPVVERTLRAMLAQDLPYHYDVWLAIERPMGRAMYWCRQHGVKVSCRYGVPDYQRAQWPRRTRCKEGNLAYFYDKHGYENYDVVAQLDADHVPARDYLRNVVRPFANPTVGYVAAPSICDSNRRRGWTVRGRLYKEASMHGPVQAGCNGGWAPVCIGSHYAVRTQALRDVGGLGPELAEDYSTTLWLQAAGWDGVFAIDAEAHGEGPETFEDMLTQELQWSRSLGTILVRWAPRKLLRASGRARTRLLFSLIFYFAQGLLYITASALPTVGLVWHRSWGGASLLDFYLHIWPCSLLLTAALAWLRRCGALRPLDAKLWSPDLVLFQLTRWPWATFGFLRGIWDGLRSPARSFKVTPKGQRADAQLGLALVTPPLLLALLPAAGLLTDASPGKTLGLFVITLAQAACYLVTAVAIVLLHVRSSESSRPAGAHARGAAIVVTVFSSLLVIAVAWRIASLHLAWT